MVHHPFIPPSTEQKMYGNLLSIRHVPGTRAPGVNKTAAVSGSWSSVPEEDTDVAYGQ